ncbi:MAG: phthiocerol/phthiodiolone dimycocerosyl transferase family protein [Segniliparus sp.]|uniref:phthiocerol/phthiodiolone dimycocerosyl transferase family protein n=1 Tax=Segniliparus sp. TaxID=2804064 RepID=UPI003F325D86
MAPSEELFAFRAQHVRYTLWCEGALDLDALSGAFEALLLAHPALGGGLLRTEDGGWEFVQARSGAAPARTRVYHGDPDDLDEGFTELDQTYELSGLDVVVQGAAARVCLQAHHAVADGRHGLVLLAELWSHYTNIVTTGSTTPAPHPAPMSMEHHFAARGIERIQPVAFKRYAAHAAQLVAAAEHEVPAQLSSARVRLSKAETESLVLLGHKEGLTLNGLASAAFLLARAQVVGEPVVAVPYQFAIDLRTRVEPPISMVEGTVIQGMMAFVAEITPQTDAVELAREVNRALAEDLDSGAIQKSVLNMVDEVLAGKKLPVFRHATGSTNWGRVPDLAVPEGLRIVDFRGRLSKWPGVQPDPEVKAPSDFYILSSFDGQFSAELFVSTVGSGEQLADAVREQFAALIERVQ